MYLGSPVLFDLLVSKLMPRLMWLSMSKTPTFRDHTGKFGDGENVTTIAWIHRNAGLERAGQDTWYRL